MRKGNFAILKEESPFFGIFEGGNVPIKNWLLPSRVELEGDCEREAYMLDVGRCSEEELGMVAEKVGQLFGAEVGEVLAEMKKVGMPIRASQVASVWSTVPAFL